MAAVIELANNGIDDAREVLLELGRDIMEKNPANLPAQLNAYVQNATRPQPKRRGKPGPKRSDNLSRNGVIASMVIQVARRFGLKATRSKYNKRRESACSIVAKALVQAHFNISIDERGVEEIYFLWTPAITKTFNHLSSGRLLV